MKYALSILMLLAITMVADAQCSARASRSARSVCVRGRTTMGMPSSVLTTRTTTTTTTSCASSMSAGGCSASRSVRVPRRAVIMMSGCSAATQSGCSSSQMAVPKK